MEEVSWTYAQRTGLLYDPRMRIVGQGYSGRNEGKNNPEMEGVRNVGPIPRGKWFITGGAFFSPQHGPFCLALQAQPDTDTLGRTSFLIHGDSIMHPGDASMGCIILTREVRHKIVASGDRDLEVVDDVPLAVS